MAEAPKEQTIREEPDRPQLMRRFNEHEAGVRLQNYRRAALIGIIFVMGGVVLDLMAYWDLRWDFFWLRVGCSLFMGVVMALLYMPAMARFSRILGHLTAAFPIVMINWMIAITGEAEVSPYYAGLNLVTVGAVLIQRWTYIDAAISGGFCILGFLAVVLGPDAKLVHYGPSVFFLFVTAFFAAVGLYFYSQLRFAEFCLREEVLAQQDELAEKNRKLEALDESKTQFFANISHELRTPLTLILAPVEKMRESKAMQSDPKMVEMVDSLEDNGLRLLRLINDLLDLVRLDSGDMPLQSERFVPGTFIEGLGRNLQPMAERKRINLTWTSTCPEGREVLLDRDQLEKIVLNLAINAIKFTPPSGRVGLSVGVEGEDLVLEVDDNGAGMTEEQVDSAFQRFWQADTSIRKKHRGVGIGLALVKSLTESLNGTIDLQSVYGEGTTFRIRIPVGKLLEPEREDASVDSSAFEERDVIEEINHRARMRIPESDLETSAPLAEMPIPSGRELNGGIKRPRVLIAEDETGLRRFLRGELEDLGCDVIEASDGGEAWEHARQYQPELIVLDFMMPEIDGITLTRKLRANPGTSQVPIILVTAHADDTPRLQALEAGVSDFLTKPFPTAELRVRIRNLLERQRFQFQLGVTNQELGAALDELKDNEARLLQAEKLSSLGRMSAGIVHEVNNPLNYTRTALHALKMYVDDVPESERADYADMLGDAEEGVNRVINIVSDLRAFTKGDATLRHDVQFAAVIEMARRLLSQDLHDIDFQFKIDEEITICGNENQLCQVFVNLIQNAAQSLEGARQRGEEPRITIEASASAGGTLVTTLRDNGCGIAPEDLENIFDPFFTKREVGEGMGLGLSICHRIIASHGGAIKAESELGKYTEFTVTLPIEDIETGDDSEDQLADDESDPHRIETITTT